METLYGHSLHFLNAEGETLSIWRYIANRVQCDTPIADEALDPACMGARLNELSVFKLKLADALWGVNPEETAPTPGYSFTVSWPEPTVIRQEVSIGNITWELQYNLGMMEYTLNRSSFDLTWSDFLYLLFHWDRFVKEVGE